jgi:hypothetical protein
VFNPGIAAALSRFVRRFDSASPVSIETFFATICAAALTDVWID